MSDPSQPPPGPVTQRLRRLLFISFALAVLVMSLVPVTPDQPTTGWDKANHLLGFGVLAILGCWSYPGRIAAVLTGLLAFGALIEILQSFTTYRTAEWGDLLADALGVLLGWGLVWLAKASAARSSR